MLGHRLATVSSTLMGDRKSPHVDELSLANNTLCAMDESEAKMQCIYIVAIHLHNATINDSCTLITAYQSKKLELSIIYTEYSCLDTCALVLCL